jgi:hypothetical protein
MAILFYDHLITKNEIIVLISETKEADNQKGRALQLIDDIIYQGIMNLILEKLESGHHNTFLTHVHERPYDPEILSYLKDHISPSIEEEIRLEGSKLIEQIIKDLKD